MLVFKNNVNKLKTELIMGVVKLMKEGGLSERINSLPETMRGENNRTGRASLEKEREVCSDQIKALMGFAPDDVKGKSLSETLSLLEKRETPEDKMLNVIDSACDRCQPINHKVTDQCKGCIARPCQVNCPKQCISFTGENKALIDDKICINCGICATVCPYNAITKVPVPCEASCPVDAISKDATGKESIDHSKCIYCGNCMASCPFGAIMEKHHFVDVLTDIENGKEVVAIVAPAIAGQYKTTPIGEILAGISKIGFTKVIEVAKGADETTFNEAEEFIDKMGKGEEFMTTSCCPSYVNAVNKHIPELKPFVSHTGSPMFYSAIQMKKEFPNAKIVFVGPCTAKRDEVFRNPNTDYMISFFEIDAIMKAMDINISKDNVLSLDESILNLGRVFPLTGGVTRAVAIALNGRAEVKPIVIQGINKAQIKLMRGYAKERPGNFMEVMSCEGGCVGGPNVVANYKLASKQVEKVFEESPKPTFDNEGKWHFSN